MPKFLGLDSHSDDDRPSTHPSRLHSATCPDTQLVRKTLIVRRPDGLEVAWHGLEKIPADHVIVSGDDDGTLRQEHAAIDREASEPRPTPYKTGRRRWVDGEGVQPEIRDDREIWKDHDLRGRIRAQLDHDLAEFIGAKKP